jgi:hypothetical protein
MPSAESRARHASIRVGVTETDARGLITKTRAGHGLPEGRRVPAKATARDHRLVAAAIPTVSRNFQLFSGGADRRDFRGEIATGARKDASRYRFFLGARLRRERLGGTESTSLREVTIMDLKMGGWSLRLAALAVAGVGVFAL